MKAHYSTFVAAFAGVIFCLFAANTHAVLLTPPVIKDFDGDLKTDITVFRPSEGYWYIINSSTGTPSVVSYGTTGDMPVSGDYDGDGMTDVAVVRPSNGTWFIMNSATGTQSVVPYGTTGDMPVPGDYDGDGTTDIAMFRPSNGTWFIMNSATGTQSVVPYGTTGDMPVPGDYDGDGTTDVAVVRPSNGTWYIMNSATGTQSVVPYGTTGDILVPGDFDGDHKTDVAVFRPSNGTWYIMNSATGTQSVIDYGTNGDIPVAGDYDGDGKTDIAVWRPTEGNWYIIDSSTNTPKVVHWGTSTDQPGGVVPVISVPNINLSQSAIDFSGVVLHNSVQRRVEIQNSGNADLKIGNIPHPNSPFTFFSDNCSNRTLSPSQKCTLKIQFTPLSQGSFADTFSIPSNDPGSSTANISLKGIGYGLNAWINQVDVGACPNPEISLAVAVTDPGGILGLNALTKTNFSLSENSVPIDPLGLTVGDIQILPVSVMLTLDSSSSQGDIALNLNTAAKYFVDLLKDTDEAAICKFSNVIEFYPLSSPYFVAGDVSGKSELKAYLDASYDPITGTRFYDAVYQSIDRAAEGSKGKRVVIVVSDGIEASGVNPSIIKTLDQVIANAKQKGINVFTILHYDPNFYGGRYVEHEAMQRLAQETGGQFYNSVNTELSEVFRQIANVLSNMYTLTYTSSSNCSGAISLDVKVEYFDGLDVLYGEDTRNVSFP